MQAILTKFLPATNVRGSRYKAVCERGTITVSANNALTSDENHVQAAKQLVARFCAEDEKNYGTASAKNPWVREFVSGGLPGGDVAHVFII